MSLGKKWKFHTRTVSFTIFINIFAPFNLQNAVLHYVECQKCSCGVICFEI